MKIEIQVFDKYQQLATIREMVKDVHYKVLDNNRNEQLVDLFMILNGKRYTIKAGTKWEASIPKVFWWLIGKPTDQKFALASRIHDYLYHRLHNRDEADAVFRLLLNWAGVDDWKVAAMWSSVRVGGHMFYAASAKNNRLSTRMWRGIVKFLYGDD